MGGPRIGVNSLQRVKSFGAETYFIKKGIFEDIYLFK